MPSVVNGIGTWYYGKRNVQKYEGVCRACGQAGTLSTHDTILWFVFLMIPLIPLGRKRIIEQCKKCQRHGVMPMKRWNEAKKRGDDAIAAWKAKPQDTDAA